MIDKTSEIAVAIRKMPGQGVLHASLAGICAAFSGLCAKFALYSDTPDVLLKLGEALFFPTQYVNKLSTLNNSTI